MDETGLPMKSYPKKIVAEKGGKCTEVVKISNLERGKYVTVADFLSAPGVYIPLMVIFRGLSILESHMLKQDLPARSTARMMRFRLY
jgi:hypothetical protein